MAAQGNTCGAGCQSAVPILVARKTITRPRFTSIITITPTPTPTPTPNPIVTATFDAAVTSTTTITVTKHLSTPSTARPPSTLDGPSRPTSTSSTEPVTSSQPETTASAPTAGLPEPSATLPPETPTPAPRPKTVVIISSACALLLVIGLALTGWYLLRRHSHRRHSHSHTNSSLSSRSSHEPLPNRSDLYGLEYRVSPDGGRNNGARSDLVQHSRYTLRSVPSDLPPERWSKPFIENLQHILGRANLFDRNTEEEAIHRVLTGGPGML